MESTASKVTMPYVNTAKLSLQAFTALVDDVRAGWQIKG